MKVPHNKITFDQKELEAANAVLASGHWVAGPVVKATELALETMFQVKGAACVGSGLSALRLALLSLGVGNGDEVLVPAYSCVAVANAVLSLEAKVVAVDVEEGTFNISAEAAKEKLTANTKAIIAVNTFGVGADIASLKALGIPVIEDCSHGFEVSDTNAPKELMSDIAIFSFYATKLIAGGEGGAVLSHNPDVIHFIHEWRDYTDKMPDGRRLNDKITDIEASIVLEQIKKLSSFLSPRKQAAELYHELLSEKGSFRCPDLLENRVWYRYCLSLSGEKDLDEVIDLLEEEGVSARRPVENWLGDDISAYPIADDAFKRTLSLPLYPSIAKQEQTHVVENLYKVLSQ